MHEEAIQFAKRYVEDILSFFGLNTDVQAHLNEDEIIELQIPSTHMNGFLIGQHGDVLRSIQFLVSSALQAKDFPIRRINLDVADYKKQRADRLAAQAAVWIEDVKTTGEAKDLRPMNAADRRIIHHVAAEAGIESDSVGEGRDRHIVLKPAS
ncbi:MAG: Single-stranded nucleic acid binding domain protein [Candidatus Saccharibacteria bacterium]|nr:Single-stranded nucleic acid binding domain protein [Candidatus Saccharibacteria bacterium]